MRLDPARSRATLGSMALPATVLLLAAAAAAAPQEIRIVKPPAPVQQVKPQFVNPQPVPLRGGIDTKTTYVPLLPSDEDLARTEVAPELVRLARALDADTYAERASARTAIIERKVSPNELMALLLRKDLSGEARHVLVAVLQDRIMNAPRGALGIRMEGLGEIGGGVRVSGLVAGMPAERLIQVGDVIMNVNGNDLRDRTDLVRSVQTMPPGSEVKLKVRRTRRDAAGKAVVGADGREEAEDLAMSVRLGSTDDLEERGDPAQQGMAVMNALTLERAATANEAVRRFTPQPFEVPFPERAKQVGAPPPIATIDDLRRGLMEAQLAGGDAELVAMFRLRLDKIAAQLELARDPATREAWQKELNALEIEMRGAFED